MKRLMGTLFVVAIVAVTASAVDAGDRFNPLDRQRPGRIYHVFRHTTPTAAQPVWTTAGDVIRSFSFEPGSEAVATACCCKTDCGCNVAAAPATDSGDTVRSFSYEPEAVAAPVAIRRFANRGAERLWRKQHPGVR